MVFIVMGLISFSVAAEDAGHAVRHNPEDIQFGPMPGFPTCATGGVQHGDPSKGASIIAARLAAGCSIPWHWHTPNEHLMMVSGNARIEMKGDAPFTLKPGGYAMMPAKHQHQFTCTTACTLYVYGDAAFDIHYVDAQGNEMAPEAAMKAVNEKLTTPPM
jgi:quercetin dioxygenase-like cupin family protein